MPFYGDFGPCHIHEIDLNDPNAEQDTSRCPVCNPDGWREDPPRPRCKGRCGDAECEEAEQKWRRAHTLGADEESEIMNDAQDGPYVQPRVPIVIIESPYAGDVEKNLAYLRAALHDCLMRGEAPFASHGLYTQVLDDTIPEEREHGIQAGFAFRSVCDYTVVYDDLGISKGMALGIEDSHKKSIPVKYRSLPDWRKDEVRNN